MAKTDWTLEDKVQPSDMNTIGQEINQLREDVDNMDFPLSDATDGTRSDVAGSEKAVGLVMQEAQAAKQAGNERKAEVVAALVAWGISASTSDSWDSLISKMTSIINRGAQVITPGTANKPISAGIHNGAGYVVGDADLVAGNLPKDVNLFGVQGVLERLTTADRDAIIAAIVAKGVAASAADSNATLAVKIGQIFPYKSAKGSASGAVSTPYINSNGDTTTLYKLTVSGLTFTPKIILVYRTDMYTIFDSYFVANHIGSDAVMTYNPNNLIFFSMNEPSKMYVTNGGFAIPITSWVNTFNMQWLAIGY